MMRNWSWLVLSAALAAHAEPPPQLEIVFTLSRNGSPMAEVVERLEYAQGNYKLTETWKGRGVYALLGTARRVSQGSLGDGALRPREFFDERRCSEALERAAGKAEHTHQRCDEQAARIGAARHCLERAPAPQHGECGFGDEGAIALSELGMRAQVAR